MSAPSSTPLKSLVLAASALAMLLAGCSGRDTDVAEKVARAEAAAARAESAAIRAESAARRIPVPAPEPTSSSQSDGQEPRYGEPMTDPEPAA